ncbi:MAG TPA: hypothetical protein VNU26_06590 [Mycobacteriales bacterium]|nr:hypothetical protein [Mycobacteriales bacterium]
MGLQVAQHDVFQRREWTAQRIGWATMGLVVVAALAGLLGPGPLSGRTATSVDGLVEVRYQRFGHLEADDLMTVVLAPAAVTGESADVELAEDWLRSVDISGITPEPMEQVATDYGVRLTVATEPGAPVDLQITFRASQIGPIDAGVRFEGRALSFGQFIYP